MGAKGSGLMTPQFNLLSPKSPFVYGIESAFTTLWLPKQKHELSSNWMALSVRTSCISSYTLRAVVGVHSTVYN